MGEQHAPAVEAPVPPVVQLLALTLRHLEAEVLEVVVGQQLVAAPASRRVLVQTSAANIKVRIFPGERGYRTYWQIL